MRLDGRDHEGPHILDAFERRVGPLGNQYGVPRAGPVAGYRVSSGDLSVVDRHVVQFRQRVRVSGVTAENLLEAIDRRPDGTLVVKAPAVEQADALLEQCDRLTPIGQTIRQSGEFRVFGERAGPIRKLPTRRVELPLVDQPPDAFLPLHGEFVHCGLGFGAVRVHGQNLAVGCDDFARFLGRIPSQGVGCLQGNDHVGMLHQTGNRQSPLQRSALVAEIPGRAHQQQHAEHRSGAADPAQSRGPVRGQRTARTFASDDKSLDLGWGDPCRLDHGVRYGVARAHGVKRIDDLERGSKTIIGRSGKKALHHGFERRHLGR